MALIADALRDSAVFNFAGAVTMIVDDSPFSLTLTANALDVHRQAWLAVDVDNFLTKPIDPAALVSTLERASRAVAAPRPPALALEA